MGGADVLDQDRRAAAPQRGVAGWARVLATAAIQRRIRNVRSCLLLRARAVLYGTRASSTHSAAAAPAEAEVMARGWYAV